MYVCVYGKDIGIHIYTHAIYIFGQLYTGCVAMCTCMSWYYSSLGGIQSEWMSERVAPPSQKTLLPEGIFLVSRHVSHILPNNYELRKIPRLILSENQAARVSSLPCGSTVTQVSFCLMAEILTFLMRSKLFFSLSDTICQNSAVCLPNTRANSCLQMFILSSQTYEGSTSVCVHGRRFAHSTSRPWRDIT